MRKAPFKLVKDIGGQVAEPWRWQSSQLLSCLIPLGVEVFSRKEIGRYLIGSILLHGGALPSLQLIVDIRTQLLELNGRKAQQLVPRSIRLCAGLFIVQGLGEKSLQDVVVLGEPLFHSGRLTSMILGGGVIGTKARSGDGMGW